jgi:UDP-N-acetyl-D-glucosamine/UDP-N-acetyl-D-galactosamine dehydrogenase
VGGHCIGVDPYYLSFKVESLGYYLESIYYGRNANEPNPRFVVDNVIKLMIKKGRKILNSKVLLSGITFKENCTDIRNNSVVDMVDLLLAFGCIVAVYDPLVYPRKVLHEYGIEMINTNFTIDKNHTC